MSRVSRAVAVAAIALLAIGVFGAVGTAKPGKGKGRAVVVADQIIVDGNFTYGGEITVTQTVITTPLENGRGPWIWLECYKSDILVLSDVRADFPGGWGYLLPFKLGPTARWVEGGATCTVYVGHVDAKDGSSVYDAQLSFTVTG